LIKNQTCSQMVCNDFNDKYSLTAALLVPCSVDWDSFKSQFPNFENG
jgi:hypothetical protein